MTPARCALFVLPALLACHSRAPDPEPNTTAAAAEDTLWIAWRWHPEEGAQTALLDSTGAAVEEVSGIILSDGRGLWRWQAAPQPLDLLDCACTDPHEGEPPPRPESCAVAAEYEQLHLVPLAGGEPVVVMGAPSTVPMEDGFAEWWQAASLLGSVGPYLFVQTTSGGYACQAAHGGFGSTFQIWQLGSGPVASLLTAEEVAERDAAFGPKVLAELGPEMVMDADPALTAYWPSATGEVMGMRYQYTVPTSYAAHDESWDAYSASRPYDGHLPAALRAYDTVPPPVAAWWAANPPGEHHGWGAITAAPEALRRQLQAAGAP